MVVGGRWLALVAGAVLVLSGCGKKEEGTPAGGGSASPSVTPSEATTPLSNGEVAAFHGLQDVSGKASVELELDDFYFGPTVLVGKGGQSLKLELFNEGSNAHTFTLKAQGVDQTVDPGKTAEVAVTFPQSGSATFACTFHGVSNNMRGDLRTAN